MTIGSAIRSLVPDALKERLKHSGLYLRHRSHAANVYHCCVQKTASRWVQKVLSDPRVFRYSGLELFDYHAGVVEEGFDPRPPTEVRVSDAFPSETVASPLYVDYEGFRSIPKPERYRAFFVMRDPRDITVSWYFSMKDSHSTGGGVLTEIREVLQSRSREEGLRTAIDRLATKAGLFPALRSWAEAGGESPEVILVRYEDLTGPGGRSGWRRVLDHCDIPLPPPELEELLDDYAFGKLTGRRRGEADESAHLRKGVAGDWENHFSPELREYFEERTGDLVELLGYPGTSGE